MNTSLLNVLDKLEKVLPELLLDERGWNGSLVNHRAPVVECLWRQIPKYRVYLHRTYPCARKEARAHLQPWPSAVKAFGRYELARGRGLGAASPLLSEPVIIEPGMLYELVDPDEWHYVRPLEAPALSLMVTGVPYSGSVRTDDCTLVDLTGAARSQILDFFKQQYGLTYRV